MLFIAQANQNFQNKYFGSIKPFIGDNNAINQQKQKAHINHNGHNALLGLQNQWLNYAKTWDTVETQDITLFQARYLFRSLLHYDEDWFQGQNKPLLQSPKRHQRQNACYSQWHKGMVHWSMLDYLGPTSIPAITSTEAALPQSTKYKYVYRCCPLNSQLNRPTPWIGAS